MSNQSSMHYYGVNQYQHKGGIMTSAVPMANIVSGGGQFDQYGAYVGPLHMQDHQGRGRAYPHGVVGGHNAQAQAAAMMYGAGGAMPGGYGIGGGPFAYVNQPYYGQPVR